MKTRVSPCAVFVVLLLVSPVCTQVIVKDDQTFFNVVVPADWTVVRPTDAKVAKYLRYQATAPDKSRALYFYVFETQHDIDLDKFENVDVTLGWELGQVSSEHTITESVRERRYKPGAKGLYAAARFQVDGPNGYVVFAASTSSDLSFADGVFQTFAVRTPMTTSLSRWFEKAKGPPRSFLDFVGQLLVLVAYCGFLYLLTRTGVWTRRGVENMKALNRLRLDASSKGVTLGPRFNAERRKATLAILGATLGLGGYVCFVLMFLPSFWVTLSVCHLIFPLLWFFVGPKSKRSEEDWQDIANEVASTALEHLWKQD